MNKILLIYILFVFGKASFAFELKIIDITKLSDSAISFSLVSADSASSIHCQISVEVQKDTGWALARHDVECPCNAKCRKSRIILKKGVPIRFIWDLMDFNCTKVEKGFYRIYIGVNSMKKRLVESNIFEI